LGWRLGVCGLLLLWIFHAIFLREARSEWQLAGREWEGLPRAERWSIAWAVGPGQLWQTLTLVHSGALLVSVGFMGSTLLLGMLRWRRVLRVHGLDLPIGRTAEICLIAHFFNSFLLGSTGGDLFKAYYAARETHHKKTEAVVTVFVDRLIGLLAMLLFAVGLMLPNLGWLAAYGRLRAVAGVILTMLAVCLVLVGLSFWGGVSRSWPQARGWLRRLPQGNLLERSLDACRLFGREPLAVAQALGLSLLLNVACVLQVLALAWGLGLAVPPLALSLIVPMVICISTIPITPSGLGVRENLYVWLLGVPALGVPATAALSLSLLAYAGSLFWSLVGGVVYVILREPEHLAEMTKPEAAGVD
jgi:hypothetical protein